MRSFRAEHVSSRVKAVLVSTDRQRNKPGQQSRTNRRWQNIHKPERRTYLKNAYRVLLTRARQGMVIVVPPGNPEDPTHDPAFYEGTFRYLEELGLPVLIESTARHHA